MLHEHMSKKGKCSTSSYAWPHSLVGSTSDLRGRGPRFDIKSGHILCQLLVEVCSLCTASLSRKSVHRLTDCPGMTIAVYLGPKTTTQQHKRCHILAVKVIFRRFT